LAAFELTPEEMATQIEIGLDIAEMARQEIEEGKTAPDAFNGLIKQCLGRDADWKAYYAKEMEKVKPSGANERILRIYAAELAAGQANGHGDYATATDALQKLIDGQSLDREDRAWYLQEMARY
jgi:hypothetical protein